jgi:soluble lytic murein transglycosylase-like protein
MSASPGSASQPTVGRTPIFSMVRYRTIGRNMMIRSIPAARETAAKITIPLFAEKPSHPSAPLAGQAAIARNGCPGRPLGRRLGALPWTAVSTVAGWPRAERRALLAVLTLPFLLSFAGTADAQSAASTVLPPRIMQADDPFSGFVTEAAQRFDIPATWIRAVMLVESNDDASVVSPKGAIGLMQVMPGTYQDMRLRYSLGADPFQPRDNILAGVAYLREMLDCYGTSGFLAAYNAGPQQYDEHLATGRALPAETILYVARITPMLSGVQAANTLLVPLAAIDWSRSPLFAGQFSAGTADEISSNSLQLGGSAAALSPAAVAALAPQSTGMFATHFTSASP